MITEDAIASLLYLNPDLTFERFGVVDPTKYNTSISDLYLDWDKLPLYVAEDRSIDEFDEDNQSVWFMPDEYKNLDIAKWILDECNDNEIELQRVSEELLLYYERDMIDLLRYLKYLVDTMRKNNIVWGVGRGSSVASFVLFKIGIHKIDSIKYELSIDEFIK